ncbi:MAG: hypothetical protein CMA07_03370, partial [Euryarchaeota archaeon]|nr:hypothetical protein [Euryarchaeota archaeon]
TGKADPYVKIKVDSVTQRTTVKKRTLMPQWEEQFVFDCVAGESRLRLEMFDEEAGFAFQRAGSSNTDKDRSMGSITLEVSTDMDGETAMIHKLKGFLPDNRPASGSLHVTVEFQRRSAESEHDEVEFLFCPPDFFTEQEVDDLREAFNLFDTDGGGSISNAEIWTIMQSLGQKPTAEEVQAMVDDFDEDGNGEIDFEEFLGMMYQSPPRQNKFRYHKRLGQVLIHPNHRHHCRFLSALYWNKKP